MQIKGNCSRLIDYYNTSVYSNLSKGQTTHREVEN